MILAILGMHRSGTSVVANWFLRCGLSIGGNLLSDLPDNIKGHFEDLDFLHFHMDVLAGKGIHTSGLHLDDVEVPQDVRFSESETSKARVLKENRKSESHWGWKEPRTCLFLNNWVEIIPNLKAVIVCRHPVLVVESLYKRLKRDKWYKTRNPFLRLSWYVDINLRPKKWMNRYLDAYYKYNQCLLQHIRAGNHYVLFDFDDLHIHDNLIIELLNKEGFDLETVPFSEVFESKYYNRAIKNSLVTKLPNYKKSLSLYEELKTNSLFYD